MREKLDEDSWKCNGCEPSCAEPDPARLDACRRTMAPCERKECICANGFVRDWGEGGECILPRECRDYDDDDDESPDYYDA